MLVKCLFDFVRIFGDFQLSTDQLLNCVTKAVQLFDQGGRGIVKC